MKRTLLLFGHPRRDSFNGALADAYVQAAPPGVRVERIDLAELLFDPLLRAAPPASQALEPDLVRARDAIERADHLVWVFPTWWAGPPALVRGFIERVFVSGWAYRYRTGSDLPEGLLAPRTARVVTTMDSPSLWYRFVNGRALHRQLVTSTLKFCGIRDVRETTVYSLRKLDASQRAAQLEKARRASRKDGARAPARAAVPA